MQLKKIKENGQQVHCIGVYGDFDQALLHCEIILESKLPRGFDLVEGIIAFKRNFTLCLVFKAESSDIFNFESPADASTLVSTYIRDLLDMCQDIVVVPSPSFKVNPDRRCRF